MSAVDRGIIRLASVTSGQVQAQATRSLAFLNVIETTVQHLVTNTEIARIAAREALRFSERIRLHGAEGDLDPEGHSGEIVLQAAETAARVHAREVRRRDHARLDPQLKAEDGIEDACNAYIEALAEFHTALMEMRDTILISTALASARAPRVYTDAQSLMADLTAGD